MSERGVFRDMPPSGGYEAVRYKRNLPFRGPGGAAIIAGVTLVSAFGFWRVGLGNLEKRCVVDMVKAGIPLGS